MQADIGLKTGWLKGHSSAGYSVHPMAQNLIKRSLVVWHRSRRGILPR